MSLTEHGVCLAVQQAPGICLSLSLPLPPFPMWELWKYTAMTVFCGPEPTSLCCVTLSPTSYFNTPIYTNVSSLFWITVKEKEYIFPHCHSSIHFKQMISYSEIAIIIVIFRAIIEARDWLQPKQDCTERHKLEQTAKEYWGLCWDVTMSQSNSI